MAGVRKFDHISPVLACLHRLPVTPLVRFSPSIFPKVICPCFQILPVNAPLGGYAEGGQENINLLEDGLFQQWHQLFGPFQTTCACPPRQLLRGGWRCCFSERFLIATLQEFSLLLAMLFNDEIVALSWFWNLIWFYYHYFVVIYLILWTVNHPYTA